MEPLELAAEGLQYFSGPFFQQRQDLLAAGNRTHPRFRYAWQFAQADAIVLAAPLWDLSFPALLKVYIENVSVENITFGCGEAGCYGICQARRMVFLTTRGSAYEGSHLEMGSRYLQAMAEFFRHRPVRLCGGRRPGRHGSQSGIHSPRRLRPGCGAGQNFLRFPHQNGTASAVPF